MTDLGKLEGTDSVAVAINNHDQIVGSSDAGVRTWLFLWGKGEMKEIADLGISGHASDINDYGIVVGWVTAAIGGSRALIYRCGETTDL